MPEIPDQTRDEVLAVAAEAGFAISSDQLARWHRGGLLPRPRQVSRGRGRGTVTIYPRGTAEQVVALCEITANHRSLARAGFQLWWSGYPVDPEQVWLPLLKVAAKVDAELPIGLDPNQKSRSAFEGLINRRLGPERKQRMAAVVRSVANQGPVPAMSLTDLSLPAMPPSIDDVIEIALPLLASSLAGTSAVELVEKSTFDDLCDARDEMKFIFNSLGSWADAMAWLWGRRGAFFRLLAEMPKFISPADLPDLLFASLMVRRVIPSEIRQMLLASGPPQYLREIAAFKAIHDQVPGAEGVFTPAAVRALLRNKEAAGRYLPKIRDFVQQNESEVRSVIDPDLIPEAPPALEDGAAKQ